MALPVNVQRCDVKQRHFPGQVSRGLVNASSRALLSAELTSLVNPVRTMKAFIYECQKAGIHGCATAPQPGTLL